MRIAHVLDSLDIGGAEVIVCSLCTILKHMGHSVSVHCLYGSGPLADRLRKQEIPVFVHGPAPVWSRLRTLYDQFSHVVPDVVHCHNAAATIQAAAIAKAAGVRTVLSTRHGLVEVGKRDRQEQKYSAAAALFCDHVVAVCDAARTNLMACAWAPKERIVTVHNGAAPASMDDSNMARRKDGFTLINVARLTTEKDQTSLLKAFAVAFRKVPDLRLLMVGDGPAKSQLKILASELEISSRVCFLGEQNDVGTYLQQSDVFILSSVSEGMPISLLEALAAGKPAIVTRVGAMPEIIELSRAGIVAEVGDPQSLAQCIISYAQRRSELDALGRRARVAYRKYFTPERMASEYLHLYMDAKPKADERVTYVAN